MNHFKWLALVSALVLAIGFTACSNDDEKKQGGITYAVTSVTKTTLDEAFTNELVKTGNGKVTYSSSDTAVAVVNETSGEVTIKGLGVATITATVADSDSYTYFQKKANYTLIVVKPEGSISYAVAKLGKTTLDEAFTNELTNTGDGTVTYTSSTPAVAEVNAISGEVTIKGPGQAVITAFVAETGKYTYAAKTASYTLDVTKASGSISFASASLGKTTIDVAFTNELTNTGDGTVTYASSTPAVAEVNATSGEVTIIGVGQATITATVADSGKYTYSVKTASYTLDVNKPVGSISFASTSLGKTMLDEAFTNELTNTGDGTVNYTSSTPAVAEINATSGEVNIKGPGQATITAFVAETGKYTYSVKTASYILNVTKPVGSISFASTSLGKTTIDAAFTNKLTQTGDGTVTYASSTPAVAEVNATSGEVTIKGPGQTTITAFVAETGKYTYAETIASYTLDVTKPVGSISFASTSLGKTMLDTTFTNKLTQTGDGTVTYASSTPAVAEVNATSGEVTIKGPGQTTITATVTNFSIYTYAETSASYTLNVTKAIGKISFANESARVKKSDGSFINAFTKTGDGIVNFYSDNLNVATFAYSEGQPPETVLLKGAGKTTIKAVVTDSDTYTYPEKTVSYTLSVWDEATISYSTKSVNKVLSVDKDTPFTNKLSIKGNGKVTYSSSDTTVAVVNETSGQVTIKGVGNATVTATVEDTDDYTYTEKTASYTITVTPCYGTKAPEEAKVLGDIVFADGSATPYKEGLTLSSDLKGKAVAVIFYVGKECSDDDATIRTLGMGMDYNAYEGVWCRSGAEAVAKWIEALEGKKDGSRSFEKLAATVNDTNDQDNYPPFKYANNYSSRVSGTKYEKGWYLPSITELTQLRKNLDLVNAALKVCGGRELATKIYWNDGNESRNCGYWSSSATGNNYVYYYDFSDDRSWTQKKFSYENNKYSCAIHAFD